MSQKVCKNCRFWEETKSYPVKGEKLGRCKKMKMFWNCTEWVDRGDDYVRTFKEDYKDEKAFVQDGSDYIAYLITREEFGCNQFSD